MSNVRRITWAIGALSLALTGCDPSKLMAGSAGNPITAPSSGVPQNPTVSLQAGLKEAAGFSANLKEAAGFGFVTNGPVSQLKEAAGLKQAGFSGYRIQDVATPSFDSNGHFKGVISNANGTLVASGSIDATGSATASGSTTYTQFTLNLQVSTASSVPALVGATLSGTLTANTSTNPMSLAGPLHVTKGSDDRIIDFSFNVNPTNLSTQWMVTVPVTGANNEQLYAQLVVNQDHTGSGWIGKDKTGSSSSKLAVCQVLNGGWLTYPLDAQDATSSIAMPF